MSTYILGFNITIIAAGKSIATLEETLHEYNPSAQCCELWLWAHHKPKTRVGFVVRKEKGRAEVEAAETCCPSQ